MINVEGVFVKLKVNLLLTNETNASLRFKKFLYKSFALLPG